MDEFNKLVKDMFGNRYIESIKANNDNKTTEQEILEEIVEVCDE